MASSDASYEPEVLAHLHKVELEILDGIAAVCAANGITWYLDGGTALGAARHVPWRHWTRLAEAVAELRCASVAVIALETVADAQPIESYVAVSLRPAAGERAVRSGSRHHPPGRRCGAHPGLRRQELAQRRQRCRHCSARRPHRLGTRAGIAGASHANRKPSRGRPPSSAVVRFKDAPLARLRPCAGSRATAPTRRGPCG